MESTNQGGATYAGAPPFFDRNYWRVFSAAGGDAASFALYYFLLDVPAAQDPDGWLNVGSVSDEALAAEMGMGLRTLRRKLSNLKDLGAVRRKTQGPRGSVLFVRAPHRLIPHLFQTRTDVRESVASRIPNLPMQVEARHEFTDDAELVAWVKEQKRVTRTSLYTNLSMSKLDKAIAEGEKKFEEKRAQNDARRKPKRNKTGMSRDDRAEALLEYLRRSVKENLSNVQPRLTKANVAKMRQLRDAHSADEVRSLIDWVTQPDNWGLVCSRFRITGVPTPGLLLGYDTSIFPLAFENAGTRRSGGVPTGGSTEYEDPSLLEL